MFKWVSKGDVLDILLVVIILSTAVSISAAIEHAFYLYIIP